MFSAVCSQPVNVFVCAGLSHNSRGRERDMHIYWKKKEIVTVKSDGSFVQLQAGLPMTWQKEQNRDGLKPPHGGFFCFLVVLLQSNALRKLKARHLQS